MRGKEEGENPHESYHGIIPAHAGKRGGCTGLRRQPQDHPRSCGEKPPEPESLPPFEGSSPLMRGKVQPIALGHLKQRIIPAHAGKRAGRRRCSRSPWDHPRSCGEKNGSPKPWQRAAGSSPLMRGKVYMKETGEAVWRIIPAHAGKSEEVTAYVSE